MSEMTHYGDPCIHCNMPHDEVLLGPCTGDRQRAKALDVCFISRRWDNVECWRFRYTDGSIHEEWYHIDEVPDLWINRLRNNCLLGDYGHE